MTRHSLYATATACVAFFAVAAFGFYASRGNEPLFGHPLLD